MQTSFKFYAVMYFLLCCKCSSDFYFNVRLERGSNRVVVLIHILSLFTQAPLFKNLLLKCNLTVLLQAPFSGALFQIFPPLTPANISVTAWRQVNHVRSHYRAWKQICPSRSPSSGMAIFTEWMRASSFGALIPHFFLWTGKNFKIWKNFLKKPLNLRNFVY